MKAFIYNYVGDLSISDGKINHLPTLYGSG